MPDVRPVRERDGFCRDLQARERGAIERLLDLGLYAARLRHGIPVLWSSTRDTSTTGLRRRPLTLFAKFRHCNVRLLGSSFPFRVIYPHEENHPFRHYRRFCPWRLFVRLRRRSSPPRLPQGEGAWPLAEPLPLTEDRAAHSRPPRDGYDAPRSNEGAFCSRSSSSS